MVEAIIERWRKKKNRERFLLNDKKYFVQAQRKYITLTSIYSTQNRYNQEPSKRFYHNWIITTL